MVLTGSEDEKDEGPSARGGVGLALCRFHFPATGAAVVRMPDDNASDCAVHQCVRHF
jgi:hypothetical protein